MVTTWDGSGNASNNAAQRFSRLSPSSAPGDWKEFVSEPQTEAELEAIRQCVNRGCPFDDDDWQPATVKEPGLASTLRQPGRPEKTGMNDMN